MNLKYEREIFVFGSNLAGRHGAGAAKYAVLHHGAKYGHAIGIQGNSYAIPTKDEDLETLSLRWIKVYISAFLSFARKRPRMKFMVTQIGCGLAGYRVSQIAPMFREVPDNVYLPAAFLRHLYGKVDGQRKSFDK